MRYDWFYWFGSVLFFVAFVCIGGVVSSQANIIKKIDAVGMLLAAIKEDIGQCGFVELEANGVFTSSMNLKRMTENETDSAMYYLRNVRHFCQNITDNPTITALQCDKAA